MKQSLILMVLSKYRLILFKNLLIMSSLQNNLFQAEKEAAKKAEKERVAKEKVSFFDL